MAGVVEREETVRDEWIDYNGHMNVAYYVLVFDYSTDALLEKLGFGEDYRNAEDKSFFVVESHVTYEREAKKNDLLVVKSKLLSYDTKRLHIFHEMYAKDTGELCATNEIMAVHIDMKLRKSAVISNNYTDRLQGMLVSLLQEGYPEKSGRSIARLKGAI